MTESMVVTMDQVGSTLDGMPSRLPPKVTTTDPQERRQIARVAVGIARSVLDDYAAERVKKQSPFTKGGRLGYGRSSKEADIERLLKMREQIGYHLRLTREALGYTVLDVARALNKESIRGNISKLERKLGGQYPSNWSEPLVRRLLAYYEKEVRKLERGR